MVTHRCDLSQAPSWMQNRMCKLAKPEEGAVEDEKQPTKHRKVMGRKKERAGGRKRREGRRRLPAQLEKNFLNTRWNQVQ